MKEIQLTNRMIALVDDEDFERVNTLKWYAHKGRYTYYGRSTTKPYILMHRFILNTQLDIDHEDRNGLNNIKSNLRATNKWGNNRNTSKRKANTSGYRGVFLKKDKERPNPWCAKIRIDGILVNVGHFKTAEDAAKAFDQAAKKHYGEFCGELNFE